MIVENLRDITRRHQLLNGLFQSIVILIRFPKHNLFPATVSDYSRDSDQADLCTPFTIVGKDTTFSPAKNFLITGLTGAQRMFKVYLETVDNYGNRLSGAFLPVNKSAPRTPTSASIYAGRGGLNYSITPADLDTDVSGVYIWYNISNTFEPTFQNANFKSTNLAGFATHTLTGTYYIWYSLLDTFGYTGCTINGPTATSTVIGVTGVSANAQAPFDGAVYYRQTGSYISISQNAAAHDIYISGDSNLVTTTGNHTIVGTSQTIKPNGTLTLSGNTVYITGDTVNIGSSNLQFSVPRSGVRVDWSGMADRLLYAYTPIVMNSGITQGLVAAWDINFISANLFVSMISLPLQ